MSEQTHVVLTSEHVQKFLADARKNYADKFEQNLVLSKAYDARGMEIAKTLNVKRSDLDVRSSKLETLRKHKAQTPTDFFEAKEKEYDEAVKALRKEISITEAEFEREQKDKLKEIDAVREECRKLQGQIDLYTEWLAVLKPA